MNTNIWLFDLDTHTERPNWISNHYSLGMRKGYMDVYCMLLCGKYDLENQLSITKKREVSTDSQQLIRLRIFSQLICNKEVLHFRWILYV